MIALGFGARLPPDRRDTSVRSLPPEQRRASVPRSLSPEQRGTSVLEALEVLMRFCLERGVPARSTARRGPAVLARRGFDFRSRLALVGHIPGCRSSLPLKNPILTGQPASVHPPV